MPPKARVSFGTDQCHYDQSRRAGRSELLRITSRAGESLIDFRGRGTAKKGFRGELTESAREDRQPGVSGSGG